MSLPGMKYDLHCAVGSKARIGTRIKSAKKLETRVIKKARLVQTILGGQTDDNPFGGLILISPCTSVVPPPFRFTAASSSSSTTYMFLVLEPWSWIRLIRFLRPVWISCVDIHRRLTRWIITKPRILCPDDAKVIAFSTFVRTMGNLVCRVRPPDRGLSLNCLQHPHAWDAAVSMLCPDCPEWALTSCLYAPGTRTELYPTCSGVQPMQLEPWIPFIAASAALRKLHALSSGQSRLCSSSCY